MLSFIHPYFLIAGALCAWAYFFFFDRESLSNKSWPGFYCIISHTSWALLVLVDHLNLIHLEKIDFFHAFFLGFSFALYGVSMLRHLLRHKMNEKLDKLLVKLALLYGLILMTLTNLISVNIGFLVYLGIYALSLLGIYHNKQLKILLNTHVIGLVAIFLCLILGYNQLIDDNIKLYTQNFFLLVALLTQLKSAHFFQKHH